MRGAGAERGPAAGVRLYGVLSAGHGDARGMRAPRAAAPAAVELLRVRDLAAAVGPGPFAAAAPSDADLAATHAVVAGLFAERAILPAPPGAVFRTRAAVAAWLELHAAALSEALRYVEDRVEARVHVERAPGAALPGGAGAPLPEVLGVLRREAVALLVLRAAGSAAGAPASEVDPAGAPAGAAAAAAEPAARAAFLVERGRWGAFAAAVVREQDARPDLHLALTGPWPPYDFVRLELGA